jgi:hypothetical protein
LSRALAGRLTPTTRLLPWVPVATVEDGSEGFPEGERLTAERLGAMAASFDPRIFRPPVVFVPPGAAGSAHQVAERHPPLGRVSAERFDGSTLWQQLEEIVDPGPDGETSGPGRIQRAIGDGYGKRSIGFFPGNFPGGGGTGWRTRHLLITAEPEGQQALPPLDHYLPAEGRSAAALPFGARTFDLDPEPEPTGQEDQTMTPEELAAIVEAVAGRVQTEVTAAVAPAITAAVSPLAERLAAAETALVAERTAREAGAAAALSADLSGRLAQFSREGRVAAGEVELELAALLALPTEGRTLRLTALAARAPMIPTNQTPRTSVTVGERTIVADPDLAGLPGELAGRVMENRLELAGMTEEERTGPKGRAAYQKLTSALGLAGPPS